MRQFRILKVEKTNGMGDKETTYKIQKKILFWFFAVRFTTHYYTHTDCNVDGMPSHTALITKRRYLFSYESDARRYLDKLQNPFREKYKGETIERIFSADDRDDVYINRNHYSFWDDHRVYEFSRTLDDLKEMIDRRKVRINRSVMG